MIKRNLTLVVLAGVFVTAISCNTLKGCFGKKSNSFADSSDNCCSTSSNSITNTIMENKHETCDKCGKTSCDTSCSSNQDLKSTNIKNKEILDGCKDNFNDSEKTMAEKILKSGFIKKIKSINELDMGYELRYEEPIAFAGELLEIISLEKKCASAYTIALIFEANSNTIRYQYVASSKESKAKLRNGFEKLGLDQLLK